MTAPKKATQRPKGSAAKPVSGALDNAAEVLEVFESEFGEVTIAAPEAILKRMGERYNAAETLDDLFSALEGQSSDKLVGRKFRFLSVAWSPYQSDRGVIPLATCDVVDLDTGEPDEFVTTGYMLVRFLRRAIQIGAVPFDARIVGKKTNSGQTALNFERV